MLRRLVLREERSGGGVRVLVDGARGERHGEREAEEQDGDALAERSFEVAEEGDGPEEEDEGKGGGAEAEPLAQGAAYRDAGRAGYRDRRRQRREREERARQQGRDGPEIILRSGVDER